MAFTIPERLGPSTATLGERKVFSALRDQLPEDYLVYYNVPVGGRHPDFLIVGADLGVVVLEAEDWQLGAILKAGPDRVTLRRADGAESVEVAEWLRGQGVAACVLGGDDVSDGVRVSTVHSAKGLDADAVLILAVHRLQQVDGSNARRLLYIAMTRARRELLIHSHADAPIVDVIERATAPGEPEHARLAGAG